MSPDNWKISLCIGGQWSAGADARTVPITDPANGSQLGTVAVAERADLERAVAAAQRGFKYWCNQPALERAKVLFKAASIVRDRKEAIAHLLTREQGKPLVEARGEIDIAADIIDWCAEEAKRLYGRVVPARRAGVLQLVLPVPVGPVAAFAPWNFPVNQSVRKLAAALAAGCSIVLKGPEETPASTAALVQAFLDAGVPGDAVSLVFGIPSEISDFLVPHPLIRKVTFTGSTAVGKQLAAMAGLHMKRVTMELGGHAPVLVFEDADIDQAASVLAAQKFRNAGQVCASPTRFLIQDTVFDAFTANFLERTARIKIGSGLEPGTQMGPLVHARRLQAMEDFVADALAHGGDLLAGGRRIGTEGYFFEPTVLANVPTSARLMNEEPFGPIAILNRFTHYDDAIEEANRLPYGLAAYAYSKADETISRVSADIESGMISINHNGLGLPETPFGGIKDSGHGSEGGLEALAAFMAPKFVTRAVC